MYRQTRTYIRQGDIIEVYKTKRLPSKNKTRSPRRKPTTVIQENINNKQAINKLRLKMLENFFEGDMFCTLTYGGKEPTLEEAKNEWANFRQRLVRECRRINKNAVVKYIAVTECSEKKQPLKHHRIHHHVLLRVENVKLKESDIRKIWGRERGNVDIRRFKGTIEDAQNLASYILKKDSNAFFTQNGKNKKRWSASQNLKTPQRKTATIYSKNWRKYPKDTNTHYVDKSSVINGSYTLCEGCEYEYQFYRMIRILPKIPPLTSS